MMKTRKPRGPRFLFSQVGIRKGATLVSRYDDSERCTVVRDGYVKFKEEEMRFIDATRKLKQLRNAKWANQPGKGLKPSQHWKYDDKLLVEIYKDTYSREDGLQEGEEKIPEGAPEGARRTVQVNRYERDSKNREKAIKTHGVRCVGCDIKMEEMYGKIARGFIEIHHVKPISTVPEGYRPDIDDLVPLCPNCHAVVHLEASRQKSSKKLPLSIDKLKELIKKNRKS